MNGWELAALLLAWGLGGGSPGPATLTISGTAMARGRIAGVVPGFGIVCGSAFWGWRICVWDGGCDAYERMAVYRVEIYWRALPGLLSAEVISICMAGQRRERACGPEWQFETRLR